MKVFSTWKDERAKAQPGYTMVQSSFQPFSGTRHFDSCTQFTVTWEGKGMQHYSFSPSPSSLYYHHFKIALWQVLFPIWRQSLTAALGCHIQELNIPTPLGMLGWGQQGAHLKLSGKWAGKAVNFGATNHSLGRVSQRVGLLLPQHI